MGLAFVIVLPVGAVLSRVLKSRFGVWIHAACQLAGLVLMLAGLAMGIRMAKILDRVRHPLCLHRYYIDTLLTL